MSFGLKGGLPKGGTFLKAVRFCPACGVEGTLQKDHESKAEFTCSACHYSFGIRPSTRWQQASRLFNAHRGAKFVDYGR